jgi:hypothetical protein
MDSSLLEIFVREIKMQCRFGIEAFNALGAELQRIDNEASLPFDHRPQTPTDPDGDNWVVFLHSYSFLVHAAIVSKILWPEPRVSKHERSKVGPANVKALEVIRTKRGPQLRKELKIKEGLKIESKSLRNDLEHYDERIEAWYLASPRKNSMDWSLISRSAVAGLDPWDFRRNFEPATTSFLLEGNDYNLHAMGLELVDIYQSASEWLNENTGPARWARDLEDH